MPKTVYRSSRRDKHNCQRRDSNLQSDALTTRLLRPANRSNVSLGATVHTCNLTFLWLTTEADDGCPRRNRQMSCLTILGVEMQAMEVDALRHPYTQANLDGLR